MQKSTSREQFPNSSRGRGHKCTEAMLDAAIRWPTSLHTTVADVTVRCPHASRGAGGVTASPTEDETPWKPWKRKHAGTPTSGTKSRSGEKQKLLHAQADVLLLSVGAEGCTGWQKHAGTPLGRQRTAAKHTYQLSEEQVATIRAKRVIAEGEARSTASAKLPMRAMRAKGGRGSKRDCTRGTARDLRRRCVGGAEQAHARR